ncbi:metallophosphoesterase [Natronolimnobius sp. AArcel1]|uniref:metallophosphoesterase n=1 Tax=Natronolimnobius sp. AArcel1 TaxID=1679093 RepID=UPI0013ED71AA|nr:metallophosphoesterase [Natronolimnobius sp. AArcel1]NGM68549.1 metallophosphoesterase [Natronolimnobius sp. AArcel1]
MNIGIIADTHDNVEAAERAAEIFTEAGVEIVIHCGDFVAPPLLSTLEGFEVHGVLGNNDGEISGLEAAFDALGNESELHGRFATLEFDGLSFAVLHGESKSEVDALAAAETYDFVCYGHHHEREVTETGRTTIVNPGGHFPTIPPEHRTVALVDTLEASVRFRSVLE